MSEQPTEVTATETTPTVQPTTPTLEAPPELKPTETVDFWKQQARANEQRAKANADAAKRLQEIEDSQKSEQQRHADAAAKAQQDAAEARAESLRYKAAATHKVDSDYFDLLGGGTEDEVNERAQRVGGLLALKSENDQLKAELEALRAGKPAPASGRPTALLKPGATPEHALSEEDALYQYLYGG